MTTPTREEAEAAIEAKNLAPRTLADDVLINRISGKMPAPDVKYGVAPVISEDADIILLRSRLAYLEGEVARKDEALRFYADKKIYSEQLVTEDCGCCSYYGDAAISMDEGKAARAALSTQPEKEKPE